jgi:hypothetical protein
MPGRLSKPGQYASTGKIEVLDRDRLEALLRGFERGE